MTFARLVRCVYVGALALAACVPARAAREPRSVLLIAGQSREEFRDYLRNVSANGAACPLPGGAAFYTSLELNGIERPHANMPGDNHQDLEYLR